MARIRLVVACALMVTGLAAGAATLMTPSSAVVASTPDESVPSATLSDVAPVGTDATDTTEVGTTSTTTPATAIPEDLAPDVDQSDDATPPRAVPPQVRTSQIPLGSIVLAVLVLLGVGVAAYVSARRPTGRGQAPSTSNRSPNEPVGPVGRDDTPRQRRSVPTTDTATLDFLLDLGESLVDAGNAVNHVESTLRTVARVNGIDEVGVFVLPTALIVSLPDGGDVKTEVSAAGQVQLRLDQIDDVLGLVADAEAGSVDAADGRLRLAEIRASAPPYRSRMALLGYVCSTIGLAVILRAGWRVTLLAGVLGLVIGAFRLSTRRLHTSYQPFVPLIAATAVSISVFATARIVDDLVTFPLLVAPLITFLPGALLTIAVLELATGQIVAGAVPSRLGSAPIGAPCTRHRRWRRARRCACRRPTR